MSKGSARAARQRSCSWSRHVIACRFWHLACHECPHIGTRNCAAGSGRGRSVSSAAAAPARCLPAPYPTAASHPSNRVRAAGSRNAIRSNHLLNFNFWPTAWRLGTRRNGVRCDAASAAVSIADPIGVRCRRRLPKLQAPLRPFANSITPNKKTIASWHIIYKNAPNALTENTSA